MMLLEKESWEILGYSKGVIVWEIIVLQRIDYTS